MGACANCASDNPEGASFCRQCGAELPHQDPLLGQEVLGRYRITRLIGEGGMGRVYEAEQRVGTTTRRVAVKTLRPQLSADPQLARRFFREAETIVRLTHPNLIQFFDFGELPSGTLAMVMEYIEGYSLAELLAAGPLDPARVDRIFAQVCGALSEAHGLGIVHRDLKPDNILLTQRGGQADFVKVLDFGIAKISAVEDERSTKLTQQGMMVGTPPYMSPEQFSGEGVDARSDIYSLGVIAYEMLTNRLPFDARTPWEWASKHLTAEPAPMRVPPNGQISARRSQAIQRALEKRPEQRQQDVKELLREFVEDGSALLGPLAGSNSTSNAGSAVRPVRPQGTPPHAESVTVAGLKGRSSWLLGGAAALVLFAGATSAWLMRDGPEPAVSHASPSPPPAPSLPAAEPAEPAPATPPARLPSSAPLPSRDPARQPRTDAPPLVRRERPGDPSKPTSNPSVSSADAPSPASAPRVVVAPSSAAAPSAASAAAGGAAIVRSPAPGPKAAPAKASDPAAADLQARVDRALALAPQRVETAIGLYQAAATRYGETQPALVPLKKALTQYGDARIRELLGANRCAQAQAVFRALSNIGAGSSSRGHFSSRCSAP